MFNITLCTCCTGALSWGFLADVKTNLISKFFGRIVKSHLNSDMFSNGTFHGCGYVHSHVLLNSWLTLADDLYIYLSLPSAISSRSDIGILTILNQPVVGSIIFMQVRLVLLRMTFPPGCCCLIDFLYGPIKSTCTEFRGFSSEIFLDGRFP